MPNGDSAGGGVPIVDILEGPDVPGTNIPSGPLGGVIGAIVGLFGGGKSAAEQAVQDRFDAQLEIDARKLLPLFIAGKEAKTKDEFFFFQALLPKIIAGQAALRAAPPVSDVTGLEPIPTPEEGGPALVTERFRNLPPFPIAPDVIQGPLGFEGIEIMPVDVPLLSSFLPAVRGVIQPSIQGVLGGLAGGFLQEFLRAPQEMGLATVPQRAPSIATGGCPTEKPHTRILRFIKQNTGVSINLSRAKSLIRELGLENAARCLGIGDGEVCSLLIVPSPKRRRGISASDIRIVKRTARRFDALKHSLGHLGGRTAPPHRRRHRHAHAHR